VVRAPAVVNLSLPGAFVDAVAANGSLYYIPSTSSTTVLKHVSGGSPVLVGTVPSRRQFVVDEQDRVFYADCTTTSTTKTVSLFQSVLSGTPLLISVVTIPFETFCADSALDLVRMADGRFFVGADTVLMQLAPGGPLRIIGVFDTFGDTLAAAPDGTLYRGAIHPTTDGWLIDRVEGTGTLTRVAGTGAFSLAGDGGRALDASFGGIRDLAVDVDGALLATDRDPLTNKERLRRIGTNGIITTIAGGGDRALIVPPDTPATAIRDVRFVEVGDGNVYLFGQSAYRMPTPTTTNLTIRVTSDDASEVYEFDTEGRHQRTVHALTGAVLYTFGYDAAGRLLTVTDGDGLITTIQRDSAGVATAIVAPFGQSTSLTQDGQGWLSMVVAAGARTTHITANASGLITSMIDVNGYEHQFTYDAAGRLQLDEDPAGGSQALVRTELAGGGWTVTRTTAEDRVRTYRTDIEDGTGAQRLTLTEADGTSSVQTTHEDGSQTAVAADGAV